MPSWDERFRTGAYPSDPEPSPVLRNFVDEMPEGRALDVATGTGRNALFLLDAGYAVDAVDQSRVGLELTREQARAAGLGGRLRPIQADVPSYGFPTERYAVVTISFYRAIDRLADITEAIEPGGYLFMEHHLRSTRRTPSGPDSDRYRFAANELLRSSLGLTVLYYDETSHENDDGDRRATARVLARRSTGTRQAYPRRPD
jgi:SAM-dependent methyltransferase